jgi:molecular chaperone DnaK
MKEHQDKLSDDEKKGIEEAIKGLEEAIKSDNKDEIEAKK